MGKLSGGAFSKVFKKKQPNIQEQQERIMNSPEFQKAVQYTEKQMTEMTQDLERNPELGPGVDYAMSKIEDISQAKPIQSLVKKIEKEAEKVAE